MLSRPLLRIVTAAAGAAVVTACASAVRSERDEAIPVPRGATWAWGRAGNQPDTGRYIRRGPSEAADPIVQQRFRRAIESAMEERGFRQVADSAQPDFVLSYGIEPGEEYGAGRSRAPVVGTAAVGFGWGGGWGYWPGFYRPFGPYRPFGLYRPWGFYQPWGWGWAGWGDPFFGSLWVPLYSSYPVGYHSYGGYGEAALVVQLRLRSSGEVAWQARYHMDPRSARRMSQEQVQDVVSRLFKALS
jgi:hypothetical protein